MTATEHLNLTKQMHIDGSSSVCSAKDTDVAYISASVNIVKISISIVSRQRHSFWNWNKLLMFLIFLLQALSENRFRRLSACGRELNESVQTDSRTDSLVWFTNRFTGLIHEPIHWFAKWFDQAFEQNWLKIMNHSQMGIAHCPEKSRQHIWNKLKHFLLVLHSDKVTRGALPTVT